MTQNVFFIYGGWVTPACSFSCSSTAGSAAGIAIDSAAPKGIFAFEPTSLMPARESPRSLEGAISVDKEVSMQLDRQMRVPPGPPFVSD